MDNSTWTTVKSIVSEILDLPEKDQKSALTKALAENPALEDNIRTQYESIKHSTEFWEKTIDNNPNLIDEFIDVDGINNIPIVEYKKGSRVGPYIIDEQIGKGGMGLVFKAKRADGEFSRVVAIKLMALHIEFDEVKRRFEQEKKILASLNNPNIAQLYDAGVSVAGNPYLVMEYVDGQNILTYSLNNNLSLKERLHLFLSVCDAVEFAHKNLIIHRDLKPENILVTNDGDLKVLDFGIAKLMGESMDVVDSIITKEQQKLYSLTYASPEQIRGESINTTSDVYTLGLLLYELIAGERLFQLDELSRKEAEQIILDQQIDRKSALEKASDKDLFSIINLATRTESNQRYSSVRDLKNDVQRYLDNEPVAARQGNTAYLAGKFWKRNKARVSVAAIFLIATILFSIFYTIRINNERILAQQEAEKAQLVTDYLIDLFEQADPTGEQGRDQTVADFVQQSIDDLSGLDDDPILKQEAVHTLAKVTFKLGNVGQSENLYFRALELAESNNSNALTIATINFEIGLLKESGGHYRQALVHFQSADSILKENSILDSGFHYSLTRSLATANAHIGNIEQAEFLLESLFSSIRTNDEAANIQRIELLTDLADIVRESGNYEASVQFDSEAFELLEQYQSDDQESRVIIQNNLGFALRQLNRLDEALEYYGATLVEAEELYGPTHPIVLTTLGNISSLYTYRNNFEANIEIHREILNRTLSAYGENHWRTGSAFGGLASALAEVSDQEAVEMINTSVSIFESVLGEAHFWTLRQQLRQALIWYMFDNITAADTLTKMTVDRLIETTSAPLAYYDKLGLERVADLYEESEYEVGVEHISEFFDWYASNIELEQ